MFEVTSQPFGKSTSDELTLSGNSKFLESRNKPSFSIPFSIKIFISLIVIGSVVLIWETIKGEKALK